MPRLLSPAFLQALMAPDTAEVVLCFLTLEHASLAEPIRVVNDLVDHEVSGQTWQGYPFALTLAVDDGETQPAMTLEIDNVDRRIVEAVRQVTGPILVRVRFALASQPATTELESDAFTVQHARYNAMTVTGRLGVEDVMNEAVPGRTFNPIEYPGLF